MATLYEYYITGDDIGWTFHTTAWFAQTFTPSEAHKITSVKLKLYKNGSPGTITVSIKATDGSGKPTGGDLCSGTTNGNTLPTGSPYEWREITLGAGYDLSADTKYAIVARALEGDGSNYAGWRFDNSDPTYAGGNFASSNDSGVSWSGDTGRDFMFEEWGEPPGETHEGAATLSGVGTLAGIGRGIFIGKSTLSGTGTLAGIGSFLRFGKATLGGTGLLSAIGQIFKLGAATLSGVGTLVASAVTTLIGKATLSGTGTLSAIGSFFRYGKATLSGVGTLATIGTVVKIIYGAATLAGQGTLVAIGRLIVVGKSTLSGIGTLTASLTRYVWIALTLKVRSLALSLPYRTGALTLPIRSTALTLQHRSLDLTLKARSLALTLPKRK